MSSLPSSSSPTVRYTLHRHPPHATPILYRPYISESLDMASLSSLVGEGLSEPYSVYTYRYFLRRFQGSCVLAFLDASYSPPSSSSSSSDPSPPPAYHHHPDGQEGPPEGRGREGLCVGCIVCKVDDADVSDDEDGCDGEEEEEEEDDDDDDEENDGENGGDGGKGGGQDDESSSSPSPSPPSSRPLEFLPSSGKYRIKQGYIGMLAVSPSYRRLGIGRRLISLSLSVLSRPSPSSSSLPPPPSDGVGVGVGGGARPPPPPPPPFVHSLSAYGYGCRRVVLEAELSNAAALKQYEAFGFQRACYLRNYYLNMGDALRLVLYVKEKGKRKGGGGEVSSK